MKARFLALAALVLGMVSCQQEFDGAAQVGGEVDFQLQVAAPELSTRADGDERNGHDSAYGAIDYLTDWSEVDLRYTLEVYDADADFTDPELAPVKDRMVKIVDTYEPVAFDLRLVPNREYRFVVFADFVDAEGNEMHHALGTTLADIKVVNDGINNEYTDAYFDFKDITITNSAAQPMVLKRPYGKVRVIATDLAELNLNVDPGKVLVNYTTEIPQAFNAVTGEISQYETVNFEYEYDSTVGKNNLENHYYTADYDAKKENGRHTHMTLFTDYILANESQEAIHFTMTVNDKAGQKIKTTEFYTDIPVQRNHLTTIIGNVLTTATEINVTIDDDFANEMGSVEGESFITVKTADEFAAAFASGKFDVVVLAADIDLGNFTKFTVGNGKSLTIDLNGKTLSGTTNANSGNQEMFLVKGNLTIENGTIAYKHIGADMGWSAMTTIFDITAGGVVNLDGVVAKNLGGSAMAFVAHLNNWGEATFNVENSELESTYITVRAFNSGHDMNNISIYDSKLVGKYCFWVHNYKAAGDSAGTDATLNVDIFNGTNEFECIYTPALYGFNNPLYFNENGVQIFYDAETLAAALMADKKNITVALGADIELPISSLGQQTGGSGEYKLGGENTENITIDLDNNKLNITTTYWSVLGAKNADALFTIKNGTMTSSQATGTWNSYDLCFTNCNYAFENVAFEKAIALESAGKTFSLKNITISETHDYYAMWISAKGQTVNVDGLTIESLGRGIKIDEQYVSAPAKVTLNLNNATFITAKKAAVVVKSVEGAEINVENINIANVVADNAFAVWVDENSKAYADKVVVNGAYVKVEGSQDAVVATTDDLKAALAANATNVYVASGNYTFPSSSVKAGQTIVCQEGTVFTGNSKLNINGATVVGATFSNPTGTAVDQTINGTFKNCTFTGSNALRWCYAGATCVFENCDFSGNTYGVHFDGGANDVTFKGCTFSGFNAFGAALTQLTLEECTFVGNGKSGYNGANLWGSTIMKDCEFTFDGTTTYEWIDCCGADKAYSFENCTINGVAYTADNYADYLANIESRNEMTVKINGVDCAM